jgi:hypothetical protein
MTDRDRTEVWQRQPKRRKTNNLPTSIMLRNPHIQPELPSDTISISRFPQELSILVNGTDIRFKLPETAEANGIRFIFHHPLLSLPYLESSFQSSPLVNTGHEYQRPNSPVSELSSNLSQDSPTSQKLRFAKLLDNVRTTPDESRFLKTMLEFSPAQNKDSDGE